MCSVTTARKGQHRMPHETGNNLPTHQPKTGERNGSRVQREIRTMRSQIQREIRTVRSCREWGIEVWGEGASTDQQAARHRLFTHRLSILVQPVCQTELKIPSGGDVGTLLVQGLSGWSGARARDAGVSIDVCAREVTTPEAVAYRSRN